MKILLATGIFPPEPGGPAALSRGIAEHLAQQGHIVTLITYSNTASLESDRELLFRLVRVKRRSKFSNYIRYFLQVFKELPKVDLLYSLDWFSAGAPASLACRLRRKRYSVRIGGDYVWERCLRQGREPMPLKDFYARGVYRSYKTFFYLIRFVLQGAYVVVFNTDVQAELYKKYFDLHEENVRAIYNPVPKIDIDVRRTRPSNEIVFAGRFTVVKNVEILLRAFAQTDISEHLVLIGEGPLEAHIKKLLQELSLQDRVTILPTMPRNALYERIINCRYVIIPSWTDISPNQVLECLILGIPFLITKENYLPFRDQIIDTIDPADPVNISQKMAELSDEKAFETFSANITSLHFSHSWNDFIEEHVKIFEPLV